jgi:hypothetical protein
MTMWAETIRYAYSVVPDHHTTPEARDRWVTNYLLGLHHFEAAEENLWMVEQRGRIKP